MDSRHGSAGRHKSHRSLSTSLSALLQQLPRRKSGHTAHSATNIPDFGNMSVQTASLSSSSSSTNVINRSSSSAPFRPRPMNSSPPPYTDIPPTTNFLDAKTRSRLVQQAKKLSRVFGDAVSVEYHSPPQQRRFSSFVEPRPRVEGTSELREQPQPEQDARVSVRRPQSSDATPSHNFNHHASLPPKVEGDIDGLSIISTIPGRRRPVTADQARREKIAKLSRHFGASIPPELVAGAASKPDTRRRQSADATVYIPRDATLKRSLSSAPSKAHSDEPQYDSVDFHRRYVRNFGEAGPKQRILSLRRARKLAQVFGEDIPHGVIRSSSPDVPDEDEIEMPDMPASPRIYASESPPTPVPTRPVSLSSASTVSMPEEPQDLPQIPDSESLRSRAPSLISAISIRTEESNAPDTPHQGPGNSAFQERRRRVAKLTRFFGVGYQHLTDSIPPDSMPSSLAHPLPEAVQVEVNVGNRSRFWGPQRNMQETDMYEAIDKLRSLKVG